MAEGVRGVALVQVMILQQAVPTFLHGGGQRCGNQISSIKTQGIVHLKPTAVAIQASMVLDNGQQVATVRAMANNPTIPPAMPNTISNNTLNNKLALRHISPTCLVVILT